MGLFRGIRRAFRRVARGIRHGVKRIGRGVGRIVRAPIRFVGHTLPRAIKKVKIGRFLNRTIFRPIGKAISWAGRSIIYGIRWLGKAAGGLVGSFFKATGLTTILIIGLIIYILFKVLFQRKQQVQPVLAIPARTRFQR